MADPRLIGRLGLLTTAHLADGCLRAGVRVRCGPAGLRPVTPGSRAAGRVLPAVHAGSVDVFLAALGLAEPGDVLVADNGGRLDEACIGDLIALEAKAAGLAGIVIWGLHRDTAELRAIGLPVFSLGALPTGPLRPARPLHPADLPGAAGQPGAAGRLYGEGVLATVGDWAVGPDDLVAADDDGVLFLPAGRAGEVISAAESIRDTEFAQASLVRTGVTLRDQLGFGAYLDALAANPALTFRDYLRAAGGAVEE